MVMKWKDLSGTWYFLDVNPEPWAVGPLGVGKRNGKFFPYMGRNETVHSFKEAVKEEMRDCEPLADGYYDLKFYFSRRLDGVETGGRRSRAHAADATNMQKATEDALQGLLIGNDVDVKRIQSVIVEQDTKARGFIVIFAQNWSLDAMQMIPDAFVESASKPLKIEEPTSNDWPPS